MERLIIKGGKQLQGEINCSGAKNSGLPILAASILINDSVLIGNLPHLKDISTMLELLNSMGTDICFHENGDIEVDSTKIHTIEARYDLVKTMRASVLVMGPLVAKYGKAKISQPGGCNIGARPINFHLKGLEKMGAQIKSDDKFIYIEAKKLLPVQFNFPNVSVTGTENLMMASVFVEGKTTLKICAKEPEVEDLANFLNSCGAKIEGAGSSIITIEGVHTLKKTHWEVLFDRIEAGTYLVAGAITKGKVKINKIIPEKLKCLIISLEKMGFTIFCSENSIEIDARTATIKCQDFSTDPYPGFPTDMQAQLMALNCIGEGSALITEQVFENRFQHVKELRKMGANITLEKNSAVIKGVPNLVGSEVTASDLRASASLVLAGLIGKNRTKINEIHHIDRGYECIEEKLNKLGAEIIREPLP